MKFYHYIKKGSDVLNTGLFSFSKSPNVDLYYYTRRSDCKTQAEVSVWMEGFFKGYSRGVRVMREPLKWHPKALCLKEIIDNCDLLEIDADALQRDGLLEAIYYHKPWSMNMDQQAAQIKKEEGLHNDGFYPINMSDISLDPIDYSVCDDETGRRFAFIPFYLLVMKDGVIPPSYLKLIK